MASTHCCHSLPHYNFCVHATITAAPTPMPRQPLWPETILWPRRSIYWSILVTIMTSLALTACLNFDATSTWNMLHGESFHQLTFTSHLANASVASPCERCSCSFASADRCRSRQRLLGHRCYQCWSGFLKKPAVAARGIPQVNVSDIRRQNSSGEPGTIDIPMETPGEGPSCQAQPEVSSNAPCSEVWPNVFLAQTIQP